MRLSTRLVALAVVPLAVLGACGSDDSGTPPTTTVVPGNATPGADGYAYATGPDDVVLSIGSAGGFVPEGYDFMRTPTLLVTGDGRVFTPGMTTLEYPGKLVVPMFVQQLDPEGMQALLARAAEAQLLGPAPVYPGNDQIADASDTVVTITVDGQTYTHQAYALGFDEETDPARQRLADFVADATNLTSIVPEGSLSVPAPFTPPASEIRATVGDLAGVEAANEVAWASDSGVTLAGAGECASVPVSDSTATALLLDANQATFFTEDGVTYRLMVRPELPGGPDC